MEFLLKYAEELKTIETAIMVMAIFCVTRGIKLRFEPEECKPLFIKGAIFGAVFVVLHLINLFVI